MQRAYTTNVTSNGKFINLDTTMIAWLVVHARYKTYLIRFIWLLDGGVKQRMTHKTRSLKECVYVDTPIINNSYHSVIIVGLIYINI
jgi:hypothetical protein